MTVFKDRLYFAAEDTNGVELWVYDGTTAPTMLADIGLGTRNCPMCSGPTSGTQVVMSSFPVRGFCRILRVRAAMHWPLLPFMCGLSPVNRTALSLAPRAAHDCFAGVSDGVQGQAPFCCRGVE